MSRDMGSVLQIQRTDGRPIGWVAAFATLSWMGEFIHNRFELPQLSFLSPENCIMALLAMGLFLLWWRVPHSKIPAILLLMLGMVHLVGGGIISVIPFKFLPFFPEQSVQHYIAHILYGLMQMPLIIAMIWQIRQSPRSK